MSSRNWSRRRFLQTASSVAAVAGTGVSMARGAIGANDRISIGVVGTGDRGRALMNDINALAAAHNVTITALCDVWKVNLNRAAEQVTEWNGRAPRTCTRFGELIALDDVDAVVIATPDYAHTPIMIEALKANKDVFVEKPMSLDIDLANEAVRLARAKERVVQVGTQRRSDGRFKGAARALSDGSLGHVSRVSAAVAVNHARWARPYENCKAEDVDWDAYLFNREQRPFDPKLLRRWHLYRDFTNGLSGLWMSHFVDAVNMLLGTTCPRNAVANGGIYVWKDGREHTDTFHALMEYPEGFLFNWTMGLANNAGSHFTIHGTNATFDVDRLTFGPSGGPKDEEVQGKQVEAEPGENHMGNWLGCMRSRSRPNAGIETGHQHSVATIMAAEALETGRRMVYDPQARRMRAG